VQFGQHHVIAAMTEAAYRLEAEEGMATLKQLSVTEAMERLRQARWLETEHPSAVATVSEGTEKSPTINRVGLPAKLRRCLATTGIVESPSSGVRLRTRRVTNWRHGEMVLR
jgi:putative transposase